MGLSALRFDHPWKEVAWGPEDRPMVLIDGVLHRLKSLKAPVQGSLAWAVAVSAPTFESLCELLDVDEIRFYEMRVSDLRSLRRMKSLRHLLIHWNTKLSDLAPLEGMNLKSLGLQDTPRVRDLSPLASQGELEWLHISGGIWNVNRVATLEPVALLPRLTELALWNLRVEDGGLRPLERCRSLRRLEVSNQFATEDYAYLAARRPDIECDMFSPWVKIKPLPGGEDRMVVGKGKPMLNSVRDARRLEKYVSAFHELRRQFTPS